jgi:DNA-binding NtrC family response regulator
VVTCDRRLIDLRHLPEYFTASVSIHSSKVKGESFRLDDRIMEVERECIMTALKESNDNKSKAIKMLGVSRSAFYEKLRKYQIA